MRDPIHCLSCIHHYIKRGLIYCDIRKGFYPWEPRGCSWWASEYAVKKKVKENAKWNEKL